MGDTADHEKKDDGATKVEKKEKREKKEKHADVDGREGEKGEEKGKDKKKKDKECKDKEGGEKEKKNPEDKTDPAKLKQKLEKINTKMQAMVVKREEILKMISEAEKNVANPTGAP